MDHHYTPQFQSFSSSTNILTNKFLKFNNYISNLFLLKHKDAKGEKSTANSASGESRVKSNASFNDLLEVRTDSRIYNTPILEKFT